MTFFFFNDTATTEIYTLSLHDALPILSLTNRRARSSSGWTWTDRTSCASRNFTSSGNCRTPRSEEHTSELQSRQYLVCRLLLEKKNTINTNSSAYSQDSSTLSNTHIVQ